MSHFSRRSIERLETCHPELEELFREVVLHFDCAVLCGHRGQEEQDEAFYAGRSKLKWPQSKHNQVPSLAVDVAPWYPDPPHIRWNDRERFYYFAGVVQGLAISLDIPLRWGGDWDRDTEVKDQSFFDLPHFELMGGL